MNDAAPASSVQARLARTIVARPWLWVALALACATIAAIRLDGVWPPNPSARVFFGPDNPDWKALERFEQRFGKSENLMIVIVPEGGDVFAPPVLAAIGDLTEQAWHLPFVSRVNSLTNYPHSRAEEGAVVIADLVPQSATITAAEAAAVREIALQEIELVDLVVSPAGDVTLVDLQVSFPEIAPDREAPILVAEVRRMAAAFEAAHPGIDLRLSGSVMINHQFAVSGEEDAVRLVAPMFGLIFLTLVVMLRSALAIAAAALVISLAALMGLGAFGWLGIKLNSVTSLAPLYIICLSIGGTVHLLAASRLAMVETPDRSAWMQWALERHMGKIALAGVTTALGFFSFVFSISPPFRELGLMVGIGMLSATALTLTLLPALVVLLPIRRQAAPPRLNAAMVRLGDFVVRRRRALLAGSLCCVAAAAAGLSQLVFEDDFPRYFDERYEYRQDLDFTEARLTGVNALEFALEAGGAEAVSDPAFLREVDAFVAWLRQQQGVRSVLSFTDNLKRINRSIHNDDPTAYAIPETREAAAQYLLLYELSLGYGMDLTDRMDVERSALRVTAVLSHVTSTDMRALTVAARAWFADHAPRLQQAWEAANPGQPGVTPTGVSHVFNLISHRDVQGMMVGTALALTAISAMLVLVWRQLKIGLISLIPNLIPGVIAFGLWGYFAGEVTLAISVVLAGTIGIVVDDTVHFLGAYATARREGRDAPEAVRHAFGRVGMALMITSISLLCGFAVLAQSGFAVNADLARLTGMTIAIALAADFFLLPPLLMWIDRTRRPRSR